VEVTDGQTEARVGLEPAVGRDHDDAGRSEGEIPGENQFAMVITT